LADDQQSGRDSPFTVANLLRITSAAAPQWGHASGSSRWDIVLSSEVTSPHFGHIYSYMGIIRIHYRSLTATGFVVLLLVVFICGPDRAVIDPSGPAETGFSHQPAQPQDDRDDDSDSCSFFEQFHINLR
jgi:hypothetical protein